MGSPPPEPASPVLEAHHVTRNFGAKIALADASLALLSREVLRRVGDNGAGKSTLLKIRSGIPRASGGQIPVDGRPVPFRRAQGAIESPSKGPLR